MPVKSLVAETRQVISSSLKAIEDVIVSMLPQAAKLVAAPITAILLARNLGPVGMGQYALILSVYLIFVGLDLGIGQTAIRYASRTAAHGDVEDQFGVLRWAFRLRMLLVLILALVIFMFAPFLAGSMWHDSSLTGVLRLSVLWGIFTVLASVPTIYFQSIKRFRTNSIIQITQSVISVSGILVIAFLNLWSLPAVIGVSVFTSGLGALIFLAITPKAAFVKFHKFSRITRSRLKAIFATPKIAEDDAETDPTGISAFARYMVLSGIIGVIITNVDIWLMGIFLTQSQIGVYNVASYVPAPLIMLYTGINIALWPRVSAIKSRDAVKSLIRATLGLTMVALIGASAYALLAPLLIPYVFGSLYVGGILLAQLLSLRYCVLIAVDSVYLIGYNFGLFRTYLWLMVVELILVVSLNVWLLPLIGPLAAALANVSVAVMWAIILGVLISREMKR